MAVGLYRAGKALALACLLSGGAAQEECVGEACAADEFDTAALLAVHSEKARAEKKIQEHGHPKSPECDPSKPVVDAPAKFKECWDNYWWCCVDEDAGLGGSMMPPQFSSPDPAQQREDTKKARIYEDDQSYAWFGGSQDIEAFLGLRSKFGASSYTTFGMQVQIGFNPLADKFDEPKNNGGFGFQLLVFTLKEEVKSEVFAPTFAEWFRVFENPPDAKDAVVFSNEVVDEILKAYNTLRPDQDVVDAWGKLTGCSRQCSAPNVGKLQVNTNECHCNGDVVDLQTELGKRKQAKQYKNSFECMSGAYEIAAKKWSAGQVRWALHDCTSVDPVNTGFGLGYNTIVGPLQCLKGIAGCTYTPWERMTGREMVMPNDEIGDLVEDFEIVGLLPLPVDSHGAVEFPKNATSSFCFQNPLGSGH